MPRSVLEQLLIELGFESEPYEDEELHPLLRYIHEWSDNGDKRSDTWARLGFGDIEGFFQDEQFHRASQQILVEGGPIAVLLTGIMIGAESKVRRFSHL